MNTHKYILSIAGFDPSSGAGLTSDIKTFQSYGLYGVSVCTAVTAQNDIDFKVSHWIDIELILQQIETLFERFKIEVVKIGLVQNWQVLLVIVKKLKQLTPHIKIVLDPILKATAGATFHRLDDLPILDAILSEIYLITPNYEEIQCVYPEKSIQDTIEHISTRTNLYLKGGHRTDNVGLDQLYYNKIIQLNIPPGDLKILPKHGSGCVLSSAIASNLMLGYTIEDAAILGKKYIEQFLSSNTTLLGNHKSVNK